MAEKLATLRKNGGGISKTVLWTNSNPTSAIGDGATISLSQSYANFNYIKCTFQMSTTDVTSYEVICSKDLLDNDLQGTNGPKWAIGGLFNTTQSYMRFFYHQSGVTDVLKITVGTRVNSTGTSSTVLIPTKIEGLK